LAIEAYSRLARNIENERRAIEIRIRAERRCGELLAEMERAKRGRPAKMSRATTLSDFGISRDQSSRWQKLAAIPEHEFEASFAGPDKPSTNGILLAHAPPQTKTMDDRALWLWGRLMDFERDGLLDADPNDLCSQMLDHMKRTGRIGWRAISTVIIMHVVTLNLSGGAAFSSHPCAARKICSR
jgi:hypothetical protein